MKSKQTISKLKLCLYGMNVGIQNARPEAQDTNANATDAQVKKRRQRIRKTIIRSS